MMDNIKHLLDTYTEKYNQPKFIATDPISIPHRFSLLQDIEIIGFWTAMLAWGNRKSIINSATKLVNLMNGSPYDFILNHKEEDRNRFQDFKHRTFQYTDTLYFLEFFQNFYRSNHSLEDAFSRQLTPSDKTVEPALTGFHELFFSLPFAPHRTRKHIATPSRKSSCKRLNMFLRWMVRSDENGVDFGLWKKIKPSQLLIPLDVHVGNVARKLGILTRKQNDWKAVEELSAILRSFDQKDPVKYDYALFGMGVLDYDKDGLV